jgi:hypothetical protein
VIYLYDRQLVDCAKLTATRPNARRPNFRKRLICE